MFHLCVLLFLCWWHLIGVFGESVSVTEGDSVKLQISVSDIHEDDDIMWKFGADKTFIAKINIGRQMFSTSDGPNGRFRHRLKLDKHTGCLTITNTTTEHTGDYQLEINGAKFTSKNFRVSVYARLPTPDITRNCSSPSSNCSVVCSVVNVSHVTLSWLKGNSLLSSISVSDLSISLSLPLEVEDQDTNDYSCVLNNSITHQTTHLNISGVCHICPDLGLPLFYFLSISAAAAGSLLIVAVLVICCICSKCRKRVQTEEEEETDSALCKPETRKTRSKTQAVYENVPKKR